MAREQAGDQVSLIWDKIEESKGKGREERGRVISELYRQVGNTLFGGDYKAPLLIQLVWDLDAEAIEILLQQPGVDVLVQDSSNNNILHACAQVNNDDLTRLLFSNIPKPVLKQLVLGENSYREKANDLIYLTEFNPLQSLLTKQLIFDAEQPVDVALGLKDKINIFEREGPAVFRALFQGTNPTELLNLAIKQQALKLARTILDSDLEPDFSSPLLSDSQKNLAELSEEWDYVITVFKIKQGKPGFFSFFKTASIDEPFDEQGNTWLHRVCARGDVDSVGKIIEYSNESVDRENKLGDTPFICAIRLCIADSGKANVAATIALQLLSTGKVQLTPNRLLRLNNNELNRTLILVAQSPVASSHAHLLVNLFDINKGFDFYRDFVSNNEVSQEVRKQWATQLFSKKEGVYQYTAMLAKEALGLYLTGIQYEALPTIEGAIQQVFIFSLLNKHEQKNLWQETYSDWVLTGLQQNSITARCLSEITSGQELFLAFLGQQVQTSEVAPDPLEKILARQQTLNPTIPGSMVTPFVIAFVRNDMDVIKLFFECVLEKAFAAFKEEISAAIIIPNLEQVLDQVLDASSSYKKAEIKQEKGIIELYERVRFDKFQQQRKLPVSGFSLQNSRPSDSKPPKPSLPAYDVSL